MSREYANQLLDAIISHEDSNTSQISLKLVSDSITEYTHICFSNLCKNNIKDCLEKNLKKSALFIYYNHSPIHCFSFNTKYSLSLLFNDNIDLNDDLFNIVWIKKFIQHVKSETGSHLFHELKSSVPISLSVNFVDGEPIIVFMFSKHSDYLNKNIFFTLFFDLSFKLKNVKFDCPTYQDGYQQKMLLRFDYKNQLLAFKLLLSYYSYSHVHVYLDELIDVSTDLTDSNLADYGLVANMLLI